MVTHINCLYNEATARGSPTADVFLVRVHKAVTNVDVARRGYEEFHAFRDGAVHKKRHLVVSSSSHSKWGMHQLLKKTKTWHILQKSSSLIFDLGLYYFPHLPKFTLVLLIENIYNYTSNSSVRSMKRISNCHYMCLGSRTLYDFRVICVRMSDVSYKMNSL